MGKLRIYENEGYVSQRKLGSSLILPFFSTLATQGGKVDAKVTFAMHYSVTQAGFLWRFRVESNIEIVGYQFDACRMDCERPLKNTISRSVHNSVNGWKL